MATKVTKAVSIPSEEEISGEIKRLDSRKNVRRIIGNIIYVVVFVAAVIALVVTLVFPVVRVSGSNMDPTLRDDDVIVLINNNKLKQGDICGFYWQNKLMLKRVIAGPGDIVAIDSEGNVTVNGTLLDEPYITNKSLGETDIEFPYQVPESRYFVMGDNRESSVDSRYSAVGCISRGQVVGKAIFRASPLKKIGFIK